MGSASIFVYLKKGDLGDKTILTDSRASAGDLRQSSTRLSRLAVSWSVGQLVGRFSPAEVFYRAVRLRTAACREEFTEL